MQQRGFEERGAMSDWLKKRKISEDVVKTLVKEGYTSMEALAMLRGEDITDLNFTATKRTRQLLHNDHCWLQLSHHLYNPCWPATPEQRTRK